MPMITGPGAFDPLLGKMRTKDVSGGTASGDYTFNTAEFTVGVAGLVSLNQVPASKLDTVSDIVNVTGASVTLQPNTAYKIYATSQAITLNANTPAAGKWAYEGHLEIFTAGTGYVVTGSNVVLANALEPDAVNNCTVRFHDGIAIISVEDHIAGYIVVNGSTSGDGSLYYGLSTASEAYIAVDATLNGQTLDLGGAVTNGEKHVVGNGYTETIVSGGINCTSKTTLSNLAANGVIVSSGTLTLGDVYIPNGSTVAVSGGGLAMEKVAGNGGVIDLGGTVNSIGYLQSAYVSGVTVTNGYNSSGNGAALVLSREGYLELNDCIITGNTAPYAGAGLFVYSSSIANVSNSVISGNPGNSQRDTMVFNNGTLNFKGGNTIGYCYTGFGGKATFAGSNSILGITPRGTEGTQGGYVTISSGAIVDITGTTYTDAIYPGSGVTFDEGGATILTGATAGVVDAQYTLGGMTVPKLGNTNVVNLGGSFIQIYSDQTATASGCIFTNGGGGALYSFQNCDIFLSGCVLSGNFSSATGGAIILTGGGTLSLTDCVVTGNTAGTGAGNGLRVTNNEHIVLSDTTVSGNAYTEDINAHNCQFDVNGGCTLGYCNLRGSSTITFGGTNSITRIISDDSTASVTISSGASINLTSSIAPGGGITVLPGGCTVNGNAIAAGTYTSIDSNGQPTE